MGRRWRTCPKCGERYRDRSALSRENPNIEICPKCGDKEAQEELERMYYGAPLKDFIKPTRQSAIKAFNKQNNKR